MQKIINFYSGGNGWAVPCNNKEAKMKPSNDEPHPTVKQLLKIPLEEYPDRDRVKCRVLDVYGYHKGRYDYED